MKKKITLILLTPFLLFPLFYYSFIRTPINFPVGQIITITEGTNLRTLSRDLKNKNAIKSSVIFEILFLIYGDDKKIITGDYFMDEKLSVFQLVKRIANPEKWLQRARITLPEGLNNIEVANILEPKLKNFNKSKFITLAENHIGYIFPDTYFFPISTNEQTALGIMLNNFNKKTESIKSEAELFIKSKNYFKDFNDIVIVASIIEKEASGDIDRATISGIFQKRLSINMPLQADAAPETYQIVGLPIKAISNPGIESIKAVIYPEESKYLYYLHDKEGNIHYAQNLEEHNINKRKYLKNKSKNL